MIDERLADIVSTLFRIDKAILSPDTCSEDVSEWDSLGHLRLILEIESIFQVHFASEEIPTLTSVARLQDVLSRYGAI